MRLVAGNILAGGQTSGAHVLSSLTLMLGYCLFLCGVVSPAWRHEIGYSYGLWVRCDGHICRYVFVGFTRFMGVVQAGIILSLLLLTTSMLCLLLEACLKARHLATTHLVPTGTNSATTHLVRTGTNSATTHLVRSGTNSATTHLVRTGTNSATTHLVRTGTNSATTHLVRTGRAISATAAMGEILAALTLAYYGYTTVMAIERLPVMTTGFAVTGIGVTVLLLGSILRAMGPPATWGDGVCCLAPSGRHKEPHLCHTGTKSPSVRDAYFDPAAPDRVAARSGTSEDKVGLICCCQQKGNAYRSVPSTTNSSLDKGYRHYEEISFEEMPHPPLELLIPPPQTSPGSVFIQESTLQLQHQPHHYTAPHWDNNLSSASFSFQYLQMNAHEQQQHQLQQQQHQQQQQQQLYHHQRQQHYTIYQQGTADNCPAGSIKRSELHPQATPRQTTQQRSIIRSAQQYSSTAARGSSTMTQQHRS